MHDCEFFVLLDGAYPRVPYAGPRKSNFIDLPNELYDSTVGQRVIEDQLETGELVERLGFDGVILVEQHNGPIGLFGNPYLAGAWLAARTSRIKIGVNGAILNSYRTPVRLAEEIAALDIMSKGRLVVGLPMGHGMQHHSTGVMNPAEARERFREAHDLLMKALTETGPFEWRGEYFHIPYVNLWPRPLQSPRPPVWVPGGGSVETLELIAKHRYVYQAVLSAPAVMQRNLQKLRDFAEQNGYELDRKQVAAVITVHVAETDRQARLEAEAHDLWQYQNFYKSPAHDNFPPGYISPASLRGALSGGYRSKPLDQLDFDQLAENRWAVAGSPETVAEQIEETIELFGAGSIVLDFNVGTKHRWLAQKSLWLFAEQVMPRLREGGVPPGQAAPLPGFQTASEYGSRLAKVDAPEPVANIDGELIEVRTAHIEDLRVPVSTWPVSR